MARVGSHWKGGKPDVPALVLGLTLAWFWWCSEVVGSSAGGLGDLKPPARSPSAGRSWGVIGHLGSPLVLPLNIGKGQAPRSCLKDHGVGGRKGAR